MLTPAPKTRGFLFADLRGYTAFTESHGDRAAEELLARYREIVRAEIERYRGAEIRTEGDSFYIVFDSVADAVYAGLAIRDRATEASSAAAHPIRVGIGIHAGETRDGAQGIVSSAVNIAARVCSTAATGEVLVTDTVRSLIRTSVDVAFTPRGRRRLKGVAEPMSLFAAGHDPVPARGHRGLVRIAAALAAVGIVGVIAVFAVPRMLPSALGEGRQSITPSISASGTDQASAPASAPPLPFPNPAEMALLDRLPASVAASCERADLETAPAYEDVAYIQGQATTVAQFPLAVRAGLSCLTNQTRVIFWHAQRASDVDAIFSQDVGRLGLRPGVCGEVGRAHETWEAGPYEGRLLCHASVSAALIKWTYGDEPIYATATRRDADLDALLAWWREIGRLMGR